MKKVSTAAGKTTKNFSQPKLTIGLDLGDRSSWYCLLDEVGRSAARAETGHDSEGHARKYSEGCRAAGSRWKPGCIRRG